jgi:hypothetical protein
MDLPFGESHREEIVDVSVASPLPYSNIAA